MTESGPTDGSNKKVLFLIDDERVIATTLAIILNNAGFEVHAFFSGEDAVDSSDKLKPDFLITDVVMRGMSGIEAAIITRKKLPNCKILLFSGQAVTADLMESAQAQGHEFEILAKPVHPTVLLEKPLGHSDAQSSSANSA